MGTDEKIEIISKIKNLFKESTFWIAIPVVYTIFYFFINTLYGIFMENKFHIPSQYFKIDLKRTFFYVIESVIIMIILISIRRISDSLNEKDLKKPQNKLQNFCQKFFKYEITKIIIGIFLLLYKLLIVIILEIFFILFVYYNKITLIDKMNKFLQINTIENIADIIIVIIITAGIFFITYFLSKNILEMKICFYLNYFLFIGIFSFFIPEYKCSIFFLSANIYYFLPLKNFIKFCFIISLCCMGLYFSIINSSFIPLICT